MDGQLVPGDVVKLMNTGKEYQVDEVGVLAPKQVPVRAANNSESHIKPHTSQHATDTLLRHITAPHLD